MIVKPLTEIEVIAATEMPLPVYQALTPRHGSPGQLVPAQYHQPPRTAGYTKLMPKPRLILTYWIGRAMSINQSPHNPIILRSKETSANIENALHLPLSQRRDPPALGPYSQIAITDTGRAPTKYPDCMTPLGYLVLPAPAQQRQPQPLRLSPTPIAHLLTPLQPVPKQTVRGTGLLLGILPLAKQRRQPPQPYFKPEDVLKQGQHYPPLQTSHPTRHHHYAAPYPKSGNQLSHTYQKNWRHQVNPTELVKQIGSILRRKGLLMGCL
ncbi:hypothetical protein PCANC_24080 [Puccinia coronata f. sp. avenae]|uniref:Uncharacterized protein n=1 Tax=Puccinia coronata f. sp. avenae TaxID=200324 RepID=A0A2N5UHH3_9BASI|nr:hypothetical protein PCANC_24080 [Puccinia coronata f. sp. avenae]